jgi:hypothetical protein
MAKDYSQPADETAIEKTKQALEANGFKVQVVDNLQMAHDAVTAIIPEGSDVFTGTSVTLDEAGLTKELNESGKYDSVRAKFADAETPLERRRMGSASEYMAGSAHAITEDGQIYIASASGSQLPNIVYGADNVILVVGSQKLVKDANEAVDRVENHTLPQEDKRALKAYGSGSIISKLLIYRAERNQRVTIIIIKEAVGY